jgi:hypothetical protein
MNKKITSSVLAALMVAGSTSFTALAAMANGTVVIGNKAFDLAYANNPANAAEITNAVVAANGAIFIKDFEGNWIDNVTNLKVSASAIPAVTYKNATGVVTNFSAMDKDLVAGVASVNATSKTQVEVTFLTELDSVNVSNFSVAGGTVTVATLGTDKKTVTLQVSGLEYAKAYDLSFSNILIGGKETAVPAAKFTTPAINELYTIQLTTNAKDGKVLANGADNAVITAKLISKITGAVDTNADNLVIAFSSTYGNLSNTRVTVQDGVANVTFTSEFSQKDLVAKVDAQIIEAAGDYKGLIGTAVGTLNVLLVTTNTDVVADQKPALVSAESNQADRVTLNFNKDVNLADFVKIDTTTKKFVVDENGDAVLVATGDPELSVVEIEQNGYVSAIRGIRPVAGNSKALEVILVKDYVLADNKEVKVRVNMPSNIGLQKTSTQFILTDARKPEATSAIAADLKTVVVRFSEPIYGSLVQLDGGITEISDVVFGEFDQVKLEDKRDIATITTVDFLKSGVHSVQLSNILDFAGLTDVKNISTSQTLDFSVAADASVPTAKVTVESPEQFRITFNKLVTDFDIDDVVLQKYNDESKAWEVDSVPTFTLSTVTGSVYMLELDTDWTNIYATESTNLNYYNDNYRFVIAKDLVENPANGKKNLEIVMPLTSPIMTDDDSKSPVISSFKAIAGTVDAWEVVMDEPVKLPGLDNDDTQSELQTSGIPIPVIEFIGKDKDGKIVTVAGKVVGYAESDTAGTDKVIEVAPADGSSLQTLVNAGASTSWKLIVRSISDDIGNTASSLTHNFIVAKAAGTEETFKVWDDIDTVGLIDGVVGELNGASSDSITVTFTSGVKYTGTSVNAVNPSNYLLDGEALPKGTIITVADSDADSTNGYDSIVITLPDGTLSNAGSNVITLAKSLTSAAGKVLTGAFEIEFSAVDFN